MQRIATLLILLLLAGSRVFAYDPLYQWLVFNGQYSYVGDKVNSNMNLGSNDVHAIAKDASGNIWFATTGKGVKMWDGQKLVDLKAPKDSYVMTAEILSLAVDSKGTAWVGTSEGLSKYEGGAWTNIGADQTGLLAVREIVVTPTDKVYLSGHVGDDKTYTAGALAFYNGQAWTRIDASSSTIPDMMMQNLVLDANNHLWMTLGAHNKGIAKYDGKNWNTYNTTNGLPTDNINAIATNSSGKMYFATPKGVLEFNGTDWNMRPFSNGFGSKMMDEMGRNNGNLPVTSLTVEDNGAMWIGVRDKGVYSSRNENSGRFYDMSNSLLNSNNVKTVLVDKNATKWILTGAELDQWVFDFRDKKKTKRYVAAHTTGSAGVVALKEFGQVTNPKWTIYDGLSFNVTNVPVDIAEDKEGTIWISGSHGLLQLKDNKFKMITGKNEFQSSLNKMHIAQDGKIYLQSSMSGIKVFENGSINDFAKFPFSYGIYGMTTDSKGNFWATSQGGLSRRVNDGWETYNKKNGDLPSVIVYTAFEDSKGRFWAGTAKGLAKQNGDVWVKEESEFPSDDIQCIVEDSKGRLWVGSNKGLSILDGTTWTHISKVESPKLKNFGVYGISFDKNGTAWIASYDNGLLSFDGTTWTQYNQKNSQAIFDHIDAVKAASDGKIYVASSPAALQAPNMMFPNATGDDAIRNGLKTKVDASDPKYTLVIIQP
jgi:ligand-binding sensor domain-containing protein